MSAGLQRALRKIGGWDREVQVRSFWNSWDYSLVPPGPSENIFLFLFVCLKRFPPSGLASVFIHIKTSAAGWGDDGLPGKASL